jgi:hypothetical protein
MTPLLALLVAGLVGPNALPETRLARATVSKPVLSARIAASAFAATLMPAVAFAEEISQEIDYGTVSAPDFILPLGAGLAILTALLPIALQSGDNAAREMQERDSESFGKTMDSVGSKKGK